MSTLDPKRDHSITLEKAIEFTHRYRHSASFNGKKGGFFGKDTLQAILDQENAAGIRYYYGIDDENTPVLVLVAATEENVDLYNGELAELAIPCPAICDMDSPLSND